MRHWGSTQNKQLPYAGSKVLCRAQFQGAEANPGYGPNPDAKMVALVPPNCTKYDGWVLCTQIKAVEPGRNTHSVGKGHNGFPVLQVLQRNDGRTVTKATKGTPPQTSIRYRPLLFKTINVSK